VDKGSAFNDFVVIPLGALLIGEKSELTVWTHSGFSSGVGEQDEGEETGHPRMFGKECSKHAREVEGPLHQVAPYELIASSRSVSGRKKKMNDSEDRLDTCRELFG
jgi:hypothetical protein